MIVIYISECIEKSGLLLSLSTSIIFAIFWERNLVMYIRSLKNFHPLSPIIPFLRIDFIKIIINVMCKDVDLSIVYVKVGQI